MQITLDSPINQGEMVITALEIGEITVADIEAHQNALDAGAADFTATLHLVASNSGVPIEALRKVPMAKFVGVVNHITPFLEAMAPQEGVAAAGGSTSPASASGEG